MSEHAAPTTKAYIGVLVALLVGTAATVGAGQVDMGQAGNVLLGLGIAVIKAALVVLVFMQMKYEKRWWAGILIFPLILVGIIICSNLPDTGFNSEPGRAHGFTTPAETKKHEEPSHH